jgi:hypothetical protein
MSTLAPPRKPEKLDRDLAWLYVTRCNWYELALRRHGFTSERLMRLARKVASDGVRRRGATLGDRFDDLVSRLQMVGLQAALRYDPEREHLSYGRNGGEPFSSYVSDLMDKRIDDHFRSKSEGFGDRRYGNDGRVVLTDSFEDDVDPEVDFGKLVSENRLAQWQRAADSVGMSLADYVVVSLDKASKQTLRTAA